MKNVTSECGKSFIRGFERLRLKVYRDSNNHQTIGWGHLLTIPVPDDTEWPREKCDLVFEADIKTAENAVNTFVKVALTQAQFDAVVSLVFNIGGGAFSTSSVLKSINTESWTMAAYNFSLWNDHGNGSVRRQQEATIFKYGTIQ